jgi:hypothetical protein
MPSVPFGPKAASRAWYSAVPFYTSPNMLAIPLAGQLGNGKNSTRNYLAYVWYHLQLILNDGNGQFVGNTPIDFPYVYGFVGGGLQISNDSPGTVSNGPLMLLWLIKALQASSNLPGPEKGSAGWAPNANRAQQIFAYSSLAWRDVPRSTATIAMEAYLRSWVDKAKTYSPQQYYQGGWTTSTTLPDPQWPDASFANYVANMIPQAQYFGVSSMLTTDLVTWASGIWPGYDWSSLLNRTCTQEGSYWIGCR